ncbi:hypothetical protein AJ80_00120 [Polytolypa hystricis UAMH7299]|uniref:Thaumatin family protein n=1 Tax=Polytolypa hystricis (strain UAMH7299) TaxID=1447883 RepID=A0A2B7Z4Q4_POLH7|nr:hypothetical protein AJ80_00120 [Polytolypa hystricis UAMH7299]
MFFFIILALLRLPFSGAIHHMQRRAPAWVNPRDAVRFLRVSNRCSDDISPAIQTQAGFGPAVHGFRLPAGESRLLNVSADWQGRVWGRTNCSFPGVKGTPFRSLGLRGKEEKRDGRACWTGDCGGLLDCKGSGQPPATLAEFTLESESRQTFYDISLVDGYNVAMGIIALLDYPNNTSASQSILPNQTNPVCIGSPHFLARNDDFHMDSDFANATSPTADPKSKQSKSQPHLLPLERSQSLKTVRRWCPWDLQLQPPEKPGYGIYPYPDDHIERPLFNPCYSACAKDNKPEHCCAGKYNSPKKCRPNFYSEKAKKICPDAYSYAYDDETSTFAIPSGSGFEVVFCPMGRSSDILDHLRK